MDNPLAVALGITAIGMSLLFLTLLLFYGLLTLLTFVIRDRPAVQVEAVVERPTEVGDTMELVQAAAIAVARARATAELMPTSSGATTEGEPMSPWWALHHQREMAQSSERRRA